VMTEQVFLIPASLDRRGWSIEAHADFPPRFRARVRALLLCATRRDCLLAKLPAEILLQLVSTLARRTYWTVTERVSDVPLRHREALVI
jgi:hypothetical protein